MIEHHNLHRGINHEAEPSPILIETPETIIEEIACAIAESQAALFARRYQDLEFCAQRLSELCNALKKNNHDDRSRYEGSGPDLKNRNAHLKAAALRVQQQNKVFSAVLERMRRNLEIFRAFLRGTSLTYRPARLDLPESEI